MYGNYRYLYAAIYQTSEVGKNKDTLLCTYRTAQPLSNNGFKWSPAIIISKMLKG
jgi:hypothetical protein